MQATSWTQTAERTAAVDGHAPLPKALPIMPAIPPAIMPSTSSAPVSDVAAGLVPSEAGAPRTDDEVWRSAQAKLRAGDKEASVQLLRGLAWSTNSTVRERASFALAEIDLSRGAVDDARARLYPLVHAGDPSLAGDATFLLARSLSGPRDRAELLARYLAGGPPSPYRQQALLERADALRSDGDVVRARAIALELRQDPNLPAIVRPGLEALEARLR